MKNYKLALLLIPILLFACDANNLEVDQNKSSEVIPTSAAKPLTESKFNSLDSEQQYQVANKLAGTLYKGVPLSEFFDLGADGSEYKLGEGKNYLTKTRDALNSRIKNKSGYANLIELRYNFNEERKPTAIPLATIREFPLSRDLFEAWMAYTLANTILFSPAQEIDSAEYIDVHRVYTGLTKAMSTDVSIRDIIFAHMKSQANWRRFRSPEDNTREMIEIYLGLFDKDEDVPKASIACQNWFLKDGDGNYELVIDELDANTEPQKVLGQWVTSCEDFYQVVANHPLVIPRIVTFLVDRFFPNYSADKRAAMTQDIVAANPVRFHDVFMSIIFSEEYLLNSSRPKSFEETFFNIADRIYWTHKSNFLNDLTNPRSDSPTLHKMKQPAMALKLGRFKDQPLDSLSFAYYHSAIRERLLTKANNSWGEWSSAFIREGDFFEQDDFIHFLFMSIASRKASADELVELKKVFVTTENESNRTNQARIVFDYISRLPELYYHDAVVGE